jgi:EAL domain-containing protein (putative c-di-GMP-specific phosphodiesterase class I)
MQACSLPPGEGPGTAVPGAGPRDLPFEDRMRRALSTGCFQLHYQPIVELARLRPVSFEAMLRWRDDEGAWIPPAAFMPVAEESGLIAPLGRWALGEACRQAKLWAISGAAPVSIALPLSPRELRHPGFVDGVLGQIGDHGLPTRALEFELRESSVVRDMDEALPKLKRLADSGVRLALDDFGAEHSSLADLRRLPITKLKVDRGLIAGLHRDEGDAAVVCAVVALARRLGLVTVAEGVDHEAQLHVLRDAGCDHAQGALFSPPVPGRGLAARIGTAFTTKEPLTAP